MKQYTVAILGATGAVGQEMLKILEERQFPVGKLLLLASEKSAGKELSFRGAQVPVEPAAPEAFQGADFVLGAASSAVARRFAPAIRASGAVFVDNSSAFRLEPEVPLVVPEVNPADARNHKGLIANPNCSTIIAATALGALQKRSPILSVTASTYQAVSGAGAGGPIELLEQTAALIAGKPVEIRVFPQQIAYNVLAQIGKPQYLGYTDEEMKMQNEGRKILHAPQLTVSCTCVRVPVVRSHSIFLGVRFERPVSVEEARRAIAAAPGCRLADDLENGVYPTPLAASNQDTVLVGRIRPDLTDPKGLCLWCCGDQLRKGAATNAVQIMELLA